MDFVSVQQNKRTDSLKKEDVYTSCLHKSTKKKHKHIKKMWHKKWPKTKNDCRDYPKSPSNIPSNQMDFFRSNWIKKEWKIYQRKTAGHDLLNHFLSPSFSLYLFFDSFSLASYDNCIEQAHITMNKQENKMCNFEGINRYILLNKMV